MDGPPLRLAVVGLGSIAREVHLPSLRRLPGVEVVGLVDAAPAAIQRAVAETGLGPGFASVTALLETARPAAALVLTPKQTHYAVVRTLLEASVDVFCEKPLTTRLPEAEALVTLAAATRRILMVGFNRRYAPVYVTAREAFAARPPEACLAMKDRPGTEYRATFENAVHMVDLLRWFCGEAIDVQGAAAFVDPYRETMAAATLTFDSGALAVTEMTPMHMGWAHVADKLGFRQELEHFVECVRTRSGPRTSGADAARTQALMDRLLGAMGFPLEDQPAG